MRNKYIINQETKSYLANLLATERLEVQYRKTQTASFDVKNRILTIPIWKKDLSEPVTDLFVAHEVGHALYTPMSLLKKAQKQKINHSIVNVVEDARIEKLIKRKYNGLRQSFIRGYRELIAKDFFGTAKKDVNEMLLIDRLNIHFKSSHISSNVKFTSEEMKFVEMIEKLETPDDVIKVSKKLQEYCNIEKEEKNIEQQINFDDHELQEVNPDELSDEEKENAQPYESDFRENDSEEEETEEGESSDSKTKENKDEEEKDTGDKLSVGAGGFNDTNQAFSETDVAWEQKRNQIVDDEAIDNHYCSIYDFSKHNDIIVDYKEVLNDFRKKHQEEMSPAPDEYSVRNNDDYKDNYAKALNEAKRRYKKFSKTSLQTVMYLVKEFEMKKSAAQYARASSDRTGVVDPLKLHSYKYADDIFKKITILPDGKNHGLMLLLDWSGSMYDKILPTVEQLINLTMFCRKINVPFEVYAFTNNTDSGYRSDYNDGRTYNYKLGDIVLDGRYRLINWASSRMNNKDFDENMFNLYYVANKMADRGGRWYDDERSCYDYLTYPESYYMSSTPLNDAIMHFHHLVPQFMKKHSIEKMNTILLTDGHSDRGASRYDPTLDYHKGRLVFVSKKTRKQYKLEGGGSSSYLLTNALLDNLRQETGTKIIGFYIQSRKSIELYNFRESHGKVEDNFKHLSYEITEKLKKEWRKNKCVITERGLHDTVYDEHYTIASNTMKVSDEGMATPSENAKTGELKRLFAKSRNNSLQSRVVLNRFIKLVA